MKKRSVWSIISIFLLFSLLAACSPAATTSSPSTSTGPTTGPPTTAVTTQPSSDKPQYGGTITIREPVDPLCCDSAANKLMSSSLVLNYAYEQILDFDWTKGPAGTGEYDNLAVTSPDAMMGPTLVESVEKPSPDVWVLNIRQGIHYQQPDTAAGQLVGGREMTADDIVKTYERNVHGPNSAMGVLQPRCADAFKIEKTGPWQVTFTTPVQPITAQWWVIEGGGFGVMYPPELIEKYGDLNDWHNTVGTGPWILQDWVQGSSSTWVRNPNYWGTNPVGPGKGDQLPYADMVKRVVIPDSSTYLAAVRTGKIDMAPALMYDDFTQLNSTAPDIQYREYLGDGFANAYAVQLNLADKTKPWADVRVRQALMLAVDYDSIISGYFKGKAEKDTVLVNRNFADHGYQPLSSMSQSVQDLYGYNPDKAKQLLSDAGYPDGFKADVLVPSVPAARADEMSIIKGMWNKIGVDVTIRPTDSAALTTIVTRTFKWDDMFYGTFQGGTVGDFGFSLYTYFGYYRGDNRLQFASRTDPNGTPDPTIEKAFATTQDNLYVNWPAAYKAVEEIRPYLIEQAFKIPFPQPLTYSMWWPWMKNTFGEGPTPVFLKYYWVDQNLKKSMGF